MSEEAATVDGGTMYAVDVGSEPLGMQPWAVDARRAQVVFAASHRVETFVSAGGRGPDPHLAGLASGGGRGSTTSRAGRSRRPAGRLS
ncbi:hypothetical protein ACIO8F_39510 [Streptomyces sp. NPDC087228]|uniref:hypothetical protein n=1 Tax=Streptomyces sp. NPDC087228 TaxID=3365772 RepID=UPI00380B2466